jgi:predicted RNase H-like nuclease (RuvC/YqgF family)
MNKTTFEIISSIKKEELEYYKAKLKEFEKTISSLKKRNPNLKIPLSFIKNGLYYSKNIRRLEKELKGLDENEN